MDLNGIMTVISTVGFPIAACVAMFWYMQKKDISHAQQIDKFSESFNSNTEVMTKLLERLDKDAR